MKPSIQLTCLFFSLLVSFSLQAGKSKKGDKKPVINYIQNGEFKGTSRWKSYYNKKFIVKEPGNSKNKAARLTGNSYYHRIWQKLKKSPSTIKKIQSFTVTFKVRSLTNKEESNSIYFYLREHPYYGNYGRSGSTKVYESVQCTKKWTKHTVELPNDPSLKIKYFEINSYASNGILIDDIVLTPVFDTEEKK